MIPQGWRAGVSRLRRKGCESIGITRYSRPALHGLDRKLEKHLNFDGGFFIEAGANDGYAQSNTYFLERARKWTGILVEPVPELARRCRQERPNSLVLQAALVAAEYPRDTVELDFAGLMSVSENAFSSAEARKAHVARGLIATNIPHSYRVVAPARTIDSILSTEALGRDVNLLSLDVEGDEMNALAGLNLNASLPQMICVEARDPVAVDRVLAPRYELVETLFDNGSYQDLLYRRRTRL